MKMTAAHYAQVIGIVVAVFLAVGIIFWAIAEGAIVERLPTTPNENSPNYVPKTNPGQ